MTIYNKYKTATLDTIDNNLYKLVEDIKDLTFKKLTPSHLNKTMQEMIKEE